MDKLCSLLLSAWMAIAGFFSFLIDIPASWIMSFYWKAPAPVIAEGEFAPFPPLGEVDFTVPADGSIEAVRDLIREARAGGNNKHFTVLIEDGEYNITQIAFDGRDHDTTYRSRDGGAILNGGMRLDPGDFAPVNAEIAARLSKDAREHVVQTDLTALGLTADGWGKMYSYGGFTTASKYDGGVGPLPCELFVNGRRCVTARYPNGNEWLNIGKVLDNGDSHETYGNGTVVIPGWDTLRNPRGATFAMDQTTAKRAASWAPSGDIWIFGFFKWDWADMSTRVKAFDNAAGTLTTEFASNYGYAEGGSYHFYNVLEELDAPGEWYLDRAAGLLYLWPPEGDFGNARIDLSLSTQTLLSGSGLKNMNFIGLTLQGTRGDAILLTGDNLLIDHCLVRNIAGSAISVTGYNNTVSNNEITRTGARGITVSGGDATTLTPGNSRAVNNLVHDWSEVVKTYQGGVHLYGTGNLAAHNEFYNSPHTAIFFGGNNHVIEHNLIHDVCLETSDAGAIYDGRSWFSAWGTAVRGNVIYNLGSGGHTPDGIYLDDGLSGVTVEDNLLVNVPGLALHFSGRDIEAHGNVVINAGKPVSYDDRTRVSALGESSWYHHAVENGPQWQELWNSPWQTDIWKAAYPKLAAYTSDFNDIDNPGFAANPAGSSVTGNVFAGNKPGYAASVQRFSTVAPNEQYGLWGGRKYWMLPGYEDLPLGQVGRRAS